MQDQDDMENTHKLAVFAQREHVAKPGARWRTLLSANRSATAPQAKASGKKRNQAYKWATIRDKFRNLAVYTNGGPTKVPASHDERADQRRLQALVISLSKADVTVSRDTE